MTFADIAIIILASGTGVFGFIKGFKKSLVSFLVFFVSLAAALAITATVANALLNTDAIGKLAAGQSNSVFSFIKRFLPEKLDSILVDDIKTQADGVTTAQAAENIKALFASQDISAFFMSLCYPAIKHALINPVYINSSVGTAGDIVALELSYAILCIVTALVLFTAIRLILACICLIFRSRNPKRKNFGGRLLGVIIGAAKGFVYSFLIFCLLAVAANFSFMKSVNSNIEKSYIAKPLFNAAISVTSSVLTNPKDSPRYARLIELAGYEINGPA